MNKQEQIEKAIKAVDTAVARGHASAPCIKQDIEHLEGLTLALAILRAKAERKLCKKCPEEQKCHQGAFSKPVPKCQEAEPKDGTGEGNRCLKCTAPIPQWAVVCVPCGGLTRDQKILALTNLSLLQEKQIDSLEAEAEQLTLQFQKDLEKAWEGSRRHESHVSHLKAELAFQKQIAEKNIARSVCDQIAKLQVKPKDETEKLSIACPSGHEVIIDISGDEVKVTGVSEEGARIFFNELLKPMIDEYIKSKGAEQ